MTNTYRVVPQYDFGKMPAKRLGVKIRTKAEAVTIDKCKELIAKIENEFGSDVKSMRIYMTDGMSHFANYNPSTNCLQIWKDGIPVYENNNGMICRDSDTLADCLM